MVTVEVRHIYGGCLWVLVNQAILLQLRVCHSHGAIEIVVFLRALLISVILSLCETFGLFGVNRCCISCAKLLLLSLLLYLVYKVEGPGC